MIHEKSRRLGSNKATLGSRSGSRMVLALLSFFVLLTACSHRGWTAQSRGPKAPPFPSDFTWINTPQPLSFKHQLKGQVVLLDFWTYGCINCIHMFPVLDHLARHFAKQPFVIIGVHSAKFANESLARNIRAAVMRYKIDHPVIVDENMQIWNAYGVNSWPTFVVVGAGGHIEGTVAGEVTYRSLKRGIDNVLRHDRSAHLLAAHPLVFPARSREFSATGLAFPGKVLADAKLHRLFIADTDHNRIVESTLPNALGVAKLVAVFGNGQQGRTDGPAKSSEFNSPQGMAALGNTLYVADTNNHLIRAINLKTDMVRTVLGTGAEVFDVSGGQAGTQQGINSPWALAARGYNLYIAMAGDHQVWEMNTRTLVARALAGSGEEGLEAGNGTSAEMAQPSGLSLHGAYLYVAEPEASGIARINLNNYDVRTVAGKGLFTFGDKDGSPQTALLQHCMGVAVYGKNLLVADTYNDKLRLINLKTGYVSTFAGTGKPAAGRPGGAVAFAEPGGLSVIGHRIFVADTDNQRIVVIDGKTGQWHQVTIQGLKSPGHKRLSPERTASAIKAPTIQANVNLHHALELIAHLHVPPGTHLTVGVPISIRVSRANGSLIQVQTISSTGKPAVDFLIRAPLPTGGWLAKVYYDYCTNAAMGECIPAACTWKLTVSAGTADKISLSADAGAHTGLAP